MPKSIFVSLFAIGFFALKTIAATGVVRYAQHAGPNWDVYTSSPSAVDQAAMRANLWRITTYTPYFDAKLAWMPNAWVYLDSYAIYTNSPLAVQHPEWILRDSAGNKMYIPWGCSNGTCPQYAADISNSAFVAYMIGQAKRYLAANSVTSYGYHGLFFDDVNLDMRVGDHNGNAVAPFDRNTGKTMLASDWRKYFAQYVEAVRTALPRGIEIVHNAIWYAGASGYQNDPYVQREIAAADYIDLERGFGDSGLTGGTGPFSVTALMAYIDKVHQLGSAVVVDDYYLADQNYSLAGYFLINGGADAFGIQEQLPMNWPSIYSVNLGLAKNSRYTWNNLLRRDFENGIVLLNEPGSVNQTVTLPTRMYDPEGNLVSVVSLGAKQGTVLTYSKPASN